MGNQNVKTKKKKKGLFNSNVEKGTLDAMGFSEDGEEGALATKKFNFEKKPVEKWKEKHLVELLKSTGFFYLADEFFEVVSDGRSIRELGHTLDMEEKIKDPKRKYVFRVLCHQIKYLSKQKDGYFSYPFFVVLGKSIKVMPAEALDEINMEDLIFNCEVLSTEDLLEKYFIKLVGRGKGNEHIHIKIIITENIFRARQLMARKIISPLVSYIPQLSPEFGFFHTAIIVGGIYFQWTDSELIIPKEVASSGAAFLAFGNDIEIASPPSTPTKKSKKKNIPIDESEGELDEDEVPPELTVISDLNQIASLRIKNPKRERDRMNRILKNDSNSPPATTLPTMEEIQHKLSKIVIKWNTQFRYKSVSGVKKNVGNCQDFVRDIATVLNISMDPDSGPLRHYLEKLRKKGKYKLQFLVSERMKNDPELKGKLTQKKYLFESHKELDDFVWNLDEIKPGWKFDYGEEISLLKAFDRAFWLRYLKKDSLDNEKYKPSPKGCYFDDPRLTKSLV